MNRELLKANYLENVEADKKEKYETYEAHHLAHLIPELMDTDINCIMLKSGSEDLINNPDYQLWAQSFGIKNLEQETDVKKIKDCLKPLKKELKRVSNARNFDEIIKKIK